MQNNKVQDNTSNNKLYHILNSKYGVRKQFDNTYKVYARALNACKISK